MLKVKIISKKAIDRFWPSVFRMAFQFASFPLKMNKTMEFRPKPSPNFPARELANFSSNSWHHISLSTAWRPSCCELSGSADRTWWCKGPSVKATAGLVSISLHDVREHKETSIAILNSDHFLCVKIILWCSERINRRWRAACVKDTSFGMPSRFLRGKIRINMSSPASMQLHTDRKEPLRRYILL